MAMIDDWKNFLLNGGAVFNVESGAVLHYGDPAREQAIAAADSTLCDLSHLGLISAQGDDVGAFLQSQLTNDAREITAQHSQLSGYCSPKGRLLALFRIFQRGDNVYLQFPRELLEPTLKRLRMYILRAKVALEDSSDVLVRIGFSGVNAEQQLGSVIGVLPQAVNSVVTQDDITVMRVQGTVPRYELIGDLAAIQNIWNALTAVATPVGAGVWSLLDILAGIPQVYKSSTEEFVPQMVNLTAIGGVNFQKGCYPGQEIVARMQYLGTLKRRMYLAQLDTDQPPLPGTALHEGGTDSTQSVGTVVSAQPMRDGRCAMLAVVVIAAAERNAVHVGSTDGPQLEFQPLPYAVE